MSENVVEDEMFASDGSFPYAGSDRGPNVPQSPKALSQWRQTRVLEFLANSGTSGATAKETVEHLQKSGEPAAHHGNASGALSAMHKAGRISRLALKRGRYHIYVLNEHVAGRETQAHGSASRKDDEVLGYKGKKASAEPNAAHEAEVARLRTELEARTIERDAARAGEQRYAERNDELLDLTSKQSAQIGDLRAQVGELRAAIDTRDSEIEHLSAKAEEASRVQPVRPRKTITADEAALLSKLVRMLQGKSDGPADKPTVIPTRVSSLRVLATALARVTGDD